MKPKRLVCIVEGKGEVDAMPQLCWRLLSYLRRDGAWIVDRDPVRQPRGSLVNQRDASPMRTCNAVGLRRAAALARARPADALVVLVDADDDCPACWNASAVGILGELASAVMPVREYEAWLLWSYSAEARQRARVRDVDRTRNAKGELAKLVPGYKPTLHQLEQTRRLDVEAVRRASDSFDKLVRDLARLTGARVPVRPV